MSVGDGSVVVVGAGLSGLAAGYRLMQRGVRVIVLEAASGVGGRCTTTRREGFILDHGPELAAGSYKRYFGLVRDLGLGDLVVPSSTIVGTVKNGKVVDIDMAKMSSLAFTRAFSFNSKLMLLRGMQKLSDDMRGIDAYRIADWPNLDDEHVNADQRARAVFGDEATDYLINPLIRMIAGTTPDRVSQAMLLGGLSSWSSALQSIRGGFDVVPQKLASLLDVRLGAKVLRVEEIGAGVDITMEIEGAQQTIRADGCILTCQLDEAKTTSPAVSRLLADFGAGMKFLGLLDIKLAYSDRTRSKASVCQVPSSESRGLLLYSLSHNKAPDRAPPGYSLISVFTDDLVFSEIATKLDDDVSAWARNHIEAWYPELSGAFLFAEVHRYPHGGTLADPGFFKRIARLVSRTGELGRIELGGDFYGAGSMEAAVLWGERAADRLCTRLAA